MTYIQRYTSIKHTYQTAWLLSRGLLVGGISLAVIGGLGTWGKHPGWKLAIAVPSLACLAATYPTRRVELEAARELGIFDDAKWTGIELTAQLEMSPPTLSELQQTALPPALLFEPYDLRKAADHKHTAIIGKTGGGKSLLAMWLSSFLSGEVKVYDSDADPYEWSNLEVVGRKGEFVAIREAMEADIKELQKRTELRGNGQDVGVELIRIVEEYPTLAAEVGDVAKDWLLKLLRRGRKYKIKIILISQQFSVEALNIKGQGDIRDCLDEIRLDKQAIEKAESIKGEKGKQILAFLNSQERPCMVENDPATVPDLSEFKKQVYSTPSCTSLAPDNPLAPGLHQTVQQLEALYNNSCTEIAPDGAIAPDFDPFDPFAPEITPALVQKVLELDSNNKNQTEVIKDVWSATKSNLSKKYKAAKRKYRRILADADRPLGRVPYGQDPDDNLGLLENL